MTRFTNDVVRLLTFFKRTQYAYDLYKTETGHAMTVIGYKVQPFTGRMVIVSRNYTNAL